MGSVTIVIDLQRVSHFINKYKIIFCFKKKKRKKLEERGNNSDKDVSRLKFMYVRGTSKLFFPSFLW